MTFAYLFFLKGEFMQSRHSAASGPSVRPANKLLLKLAKHRRIPLAILMTLVIAMAGTTGYLLGNSKPAEAAAVVDDTDCVAAFTDQLAEIGRAHV